MSRNSTMLRAEGRWLIPYAFLFLLLMISSAAWGQETIAVAGKVTSYSDGNGLPGVTVRVKGTSNGTITDLEGNYRINVPEDATLIFSFVGFAKEEVSVNGRSSIVVSLVEDIETLSEVVVVGYGTQEKRDVTGSIGSVSGEEIAQQASQNPVSGLQGKVAGVQITNSGAPGASPKVRIRGVGSAQGGVEPLYVVDGTFVNDLSFLNPADIESIEILKDASSASIYGVRAANGVVLVTTKRGEAGATKVNYSGFVGLQSVTNQVEMTNAQQYATSVNEKLGSEIVRTDYPTTNWYDQILRVAEIHDHQVTISGGSENITFSASGGYLNQEGIIEGHEYERITARLQTDIKVSEHVRVGYSAIFNNYNSTDIPGEVVYQAYVAPPIIPVFHENGRYGDPINFNVGNFANPQATLDWYNRRSNGQQLVSNLFGEVDFLENFTFRSSLGLNYGINQFRSYRSADSLTSVQFAERSLLTKSRSKTTSWLWENTLTYAKEFGAHELTALLGTSAQEDLFEKLEGSANDVPYDSEGSLFLELGDPETYNIVNEGDKYTLNSYFGRINYSFKDRYLLTTTLRYDASSKFPKDNRWDYFPSVGLGWIVADEPFMQDQNLFSHLKVRGSWGKLGNSNIPTNIYIQTANRDPRYIAFFGGVPYPGASITTVVPPTLLWEVVKELDFGIDMGFLDNRLTVEADWYSKVTEEAIFAVPILGSQGTSTNTILGNYANFRNRGLEFVANWTDETSADFSYNVGLNFSINRNEVTKLATGESPQYGGALPVGGYLATVTRVGDPIGAFYGYEVAGIFQNEQEIANSAQPNASPGDFRYRDLNNDEVIDARDKTIIGNPNPGFFYGINTGFRFKNIDFQLDIQGVGDVDVYNANKGVRYGNENYTEDFFENRWHGEGTSNSYPSADLSGENLAPNTWYVEKGDYIRLRNIQLGYTLPASLTEQWNMQSIRFYLNAQNPITLFNYTGFTPEVGGDPTNDEGGNPTNAGIDRNVYPLSATYNFGVNVNF